MHALDYLRGLSVADRTRICLNATVAPGYLSRLLHGNPRGTHVSLQLAIEASRHSGGQVDIFASLNPVTVAAVDWPYLRGYLIRKGL
jgi:hypothetical protein